MQLIYHLGLLQLSLFTLPFFFMNTVPQEFDFCLELDNGDVRHLVHMLLDRGPVLR